MLKTTVQAAPSRKSMLMAGAAAALAAVAMGFAGGAHARSDVQFSVGVVLPGAQIGVTNAYPVYAQPVYVQPQPVYVQPRPVYVQPAPVYYQPAPVYYQPRPVFVQPAPVYYGRPHGWHKRHGHHGRHDRDDDDRRGDYRHGGYYVQNHGSGYYGR